MMESLTFGRLMFILVASRPKRPRVNAAILLRCMSPFMHVCDIARSRMDFCFRTKVRKQQCFSFRHNPLLRPRRSPRNGSRTPANLQAPTLFRPPLDWAAYSCALECTEFTCSDNSSFQQAVARSFSPCQGRGPALRARRSALRSSGAQSKAIQDTARPRKQGWRPSTIASVWRRNVDRTRPCISSCDQSSPPDPRRSHDPGRQRPRTCTCDFMASTTKRAPEQKCGC
jgi:hypothetical protein